MITSRIVVFLIFLSPLVGCSPNQKKARLKIESGMAIVLKAGVLDRWYPQSFDTAYGGFLTTFTFDFKPVGEQDKMIVTQARHTWTNAKAALLYPGIDYFLKGSRHGFEFLKAAMWDSVNGGFYTLVDRAGNVRKNDSIKTAYGNAFGIFALAAYYELSKDTFALNLAKDAFHWLEQHSHDPKYKGYFQHLNRNGTPVQRQSGTPSTAETGFKDQNSSIHLLEAFTELYQVWPDDLLRIRLNEMLVLIRDTIVTPKGYLTLFLHPDWTPVAYSDSTDSVIMKHHFLDHVSFGHDVETAYLMMEASQVLGLKNDAATTMVAKRMVDHALRNGWDETAGGFYDEGYYFKDKPGMTIIRDTKNWWAQAEGLNTLLIMADMYPEDPLMYFSKFELLWQYADKNLIDHQNGDWFSGGIDKQPEMKTALKGNIWKACYHQYRSLSNCLQRLKKNKKEDSTSAGKF